MKNISMFLFFKSFLLIFGVGLFVNVPQQINGTQLIGLIFLSIYVIISR